MELVAKETGGQEAEDGGDDPMEAGRKRASEECSGGAAQHRLPRRSRARQFRLGACTEASGETPSSPRTLGRKREAEGPAQQGDDEGEIIAGLPTLHEWPVEGDPGDAVLLCAVYDERTGEALNEEQVREGRAKEMKQMETFGVKNGISYQEAKAKGLRLVRSRWVDTAKEINGKPGVRSRLVAQEVNTYKREDVPMGTPALRVLRAVISHAATAKPGQSVSKKLVARYDVSVAFFHTENGERIGVVPPASEGTPDTIWELRKAMNGTREASRQWGAKIRKVKTANGCSELSLCPNTYYLAGGDVALSCHGDDSLASGEASELNKLDEIMKQNYEVKVLPRIGDPKHGGETESGRHLGRVIKWTGSGFTWEADPKYSEQVVEELKLKGSRGVDTPSSKATGAGNRLVDRELEKERADVFRRVAGIILYMSVDRPSLQFAASELAEGMSRPLEIHWLRLKRVGRYIATCPVEKWHFELQKTPSVLESCSDSDWATDKKSRKSMSSTCV